MRGWLLAGAAMLELGCLTGEARAQTEGPAILAPTQGQEAFLPSAQSPATANENNNARATARPGVFANPTPGTIVVHVNGRVHTGFKSIWSSADQRFATAPAGAPGGPLLAPGATPSLATLIGTNGTGPVKLAPDALFSYARIYLGADAMATNGLRYGGAIEVRQNFIGQISNNQSSGASGYSSLETLFVRRAFTYVAGDQWGIVRAGQADGIISLFDNGVTTFQFLPTNDLQNGDDFASLAPTNAAVPFFFLSGSGNEYAYAKAVYLSPQVAGFDLGLQYAPLALVPQHGMSETAFLIGAKYAIGPFTIGVSAERGDYQGNVNLTGISQRRGRAIDFGASYAVAPGLVVYAEYQYEEIYQGDFNFISGAIGSGANNSITAQGFLVGNVVNF
jgi:predicted porin